MVCATVMQVDQEKQQERQQRAEQEQEVSWEVALEQVVAVTRVPRPATRQCNRSLAG